MICKRKECNHKLPKKPCYFANELAVEEGYCSYICWITDKEDECRKAVLKYVKTKKK